MRKLVVLTFVTLDGVMQAPGGPQEDTAGDFKYGGWSAPYWDEFMDKVMTEQMSAPYSLLLGRKTYEIFASYWPKSDEPLAKEFNLCKKYVVTKTLNKLDWENSVLVKGDIPAEIRIFKEQDGPELQVHGSSNFIQTLLKNDLIDEFRLKIFPLALGTGKRLFGEGVQPASFKLLDSKTSPKGVVAATFTRSGNVETGSFG